MRHISVASAPGAGVTSLPGKAGFLPVIFKVEYWDFLNRGAI